MWNKFKNIHDIEPGRKIIIITDYGASCISGYVAEYSHDRREILDAEEGEAIHKEWFKNSIWAYLPDDYALHFMEITDADWY